MCLSLKNLFSVILNEVKNPIEAHYFHKNKCHRVHREKVKTNPQGFGRQINYNPHLNLYTKILSFTKTGWYLFKKSFDVSVFESQCCSPYNNCAP